MPNWARPSNPARRLVVVGGDRDERPTQAPGPSTGPTPDRGPAGLREAAVVLVFGLLALGWFALLRDVRAGLPGDLPAPVREASVNGPASPPGGHPGRSVEAPAGVETTGATGRE
jgi:hypothetical protein